MTPLTHDFFLMCGFVCTRQYEDEAEYQFNKDEVHGDMSAHSMNPIDPNPIWNFYFYGSEMPWSPQTEEELLRLLFGWLGPEHTETYLKEAIDHVETSDRG